MRGPQCFGTLNVSGSWIRERQGASRRFCRGNVYSMGPVASAIPLTQAWAWHPSSVFRSRSRKTSGDNGESPEVLRLRLRLVRNAGRQPAYGKPARAS